MTSQHEETVDDILKISFRKSLTHRFPWLLLGLIGGVFSAKIVGNFEELISANIILAGFIPLIVYMSDAVGTQMESYVIRDFAIHPKVNFIKYFLRHLIVVFVIGSLLSVFLFITSFILEENIRISIVLSTALFFSILSSVFSGLILPRFFIRSNTDPANASGPIATILQDMLSVAIYLMVAQWILL